MRRVTSRKPSVPAFAVARAAKVARPRGTRAAPRPTTGASFVACAAATPLVAGRATIVTAGAVPAFAEAGDSPPFATAAGVAVVPEPAETVAADETICSSAARTLVAFADDVQLESFDGSASWS